MCALTSLRFSRNIFSTDLEFFIANKLSCSACIAKLLSVTEVGDGDYGKTEQSLCSTSHFEWPDSSDMLRNIHGYSMKS